MKQITLIAFILMAGSTASLGDPAPILPPAASGAPHACPRSRYYPPDAMRSCIQGTTYLRFHIAVDGSTKDIGIAQSAGNAELDEAAKVCATEWVYKPATQNGQPIETPWMAAIHWSLNIGRCTPIPPVPLANKPPPQP